MSVSISYSHPCSHPRSQLHLQHARRSRTCRWTDPLKRSIEPILSAEQLHRSIEPIHCTDILNRSVPHWSDPLKRSIKAIHWIEPLKRSIEPIHWTDQLTRIDHRTEQLNPTIEAIQRNYPPNPFKSAQTRIFTTFVLSESIQMYSNTHIYDVSCLWIQAKVLKHTYFQWICTFLDPLTPDEFSAPDLPVVPFVLLFWTTWRTLRSKLLLGKYMVLIADLGN